MNHCISCKRSPAIFDYLYNYKKKYKCQHVLLRDPAKCALCMVNEMRQENGLLSVDKNSLKLQVCVNWLIGESVDRDCWKAEGVKKCDAPNCDYSAMMNNHYAPIHNFMNIVKNSIILPHVILNIIFDYIFNEIYSGGNGLCIMHNNIYGECPDCVFNSLPDECKICKYHFADYNMKKLKCQGYTINLHHETMDDCDYDISVGCDSKYFYSRVCCLNICHQMNTWCKICKTCIGHNYYNYKFDHNLNKYPHCMICDVHSAFPHCNKCEKHSQCACIKPESDEKFENNKHNDIKINKWCSICNEYFAYLHCNTEECNRHSKYPHCDKDRCNIHSEYIHCNKKECSIHSEYAHCNKKGCPIHSEYDHCNKKGCPIHSLYPHCRRTNCDEHLKYPHCKRKGCHKHSQYKHCNFEKCRMHSPYPHCTTEGCNQHSEYSHCVINGCRIHSDLPHCMKKGCISHSNYTHCEIEGCDKHSELSHCVNCNDHHD